MKPNFFAALIAATATLTGLISKVETASAADFNWNDSWTQTKLPLMLTDYSTPLLMLTITTSS
ncbi:hypothetical protein [Nostoc sp.]|uniref:hypothetical protein n=1 Tax=Nostoc sp. TaxID=1180 RepID=UPI002FF4457F